MSCYYSSKDEMGDICEAFEMMRKELIKNQESVWKNVEGQKQLNAAFAHDLRTPLTVMQGYTELLLKYHKDGKVSEEKLEEILRLLQQQVVRLKDFTQTMKGLNQFDDLQTHMEYIETRKLHQTIDDILTGLRERYHFSFQLIDQVQKNELWIDENIILQVIDNLMSNALSFTKHRIELTMTEENGILSIYIQDDGNGFSENEIYTAMKPYYSTRKDSKEHYGIGLSICMLLCEKHGGSLVLSNSILGGGIVCANFKCLNKI